MLNNNEIRLSILCQYYRAAFNGKQYGINEENPELKDTPKNIVNANLGYLVDKDLINGTKTYTSGHIIVGATDITAHGMDVVEQIIDESSAELDPSIGAEISKETSTVQKMSRFYEKCVKIYPMCETAVKIAGSVFSSL